MHVKKIKSFIDTNIWISAFMFDGNERIVIQYAMEDRFKAIISLKVIEEFKKVMNLKFNIEHDIIHEAIYEMMEMTDIVKVESDIDIKVRDPEDVDILWAAIDSNCDYLITGDKDLLSIEKSNNLKIIRTNEFIGILNDL